MTPLLRGVINAVVIVAVPSLAVVATVTQVWWWACLALAAVGAAVVLDRTDPRYRRALPDVQDSEEKTRKLPAAVIEGVSAVTRFPRRRVEPHKSVGRARPPSSDERPGP
jgi:hypothetical protein